MERAKEFINRLRGLQAELNRIGAGERVAFTTWWPPSVNHYWRRTEKGRLALTSRAREFRANVLADALAARSAVHFTGPVGVELVLHPPDRRVRDIDNVIKPLLDALTFAGVFEDDRQVKRLVVVEGCPTKGGAVEVAVRPLGYTMDEWRSRCDDSGDA